MDGNSSKGDFEVADIDIGAIKSFSVSASIP
jgi:hypothetical protein